MSKLIFFFFLFLLYICVNYFLHTYLFLHSCGGEGGGVWIPFFADIICEQPLRDVKCKLFYSDGQVYVSVVKSMGCKGLF